jgi:Xaa-Pro aminopeptidase
MRVTVDSADLPRFAEVQRLAYQCAETIGGQLEPGITERQTAALMKEWLTDRGVDDWFHLPFAWFGDRTAFTNFRFPAQFLPTKRRLEPGMPFILDCAPVVKGITADIGYTGCLGDNPIVDKILDDLVEHRALIVDQVRQRRPFREIYEAVDRLASRQGYDNRHRAYPYHVIAHRVFKLSARTGRGTAFRFGPRSLRALYGTMAVASRQGWSPLWNGSRRSDHPPIPGVWAVEPHLAFRGVGAKFEELLVITDDDAYWLDDDLPHVRRRLQAKEHA